MSTRHDSKIKVSFDTLEIPYNATYEEARKAYELILMVWHPDKHGHDATLRSKALNKTTQINESWKFVSELLLSKDAQKLSAREVEVLQTSLDPKSISPPQTQYYANQHATLRRTQSDSPYRKPSSSTKPFISLISIALVLSVIYYFVFEKKAFSPGMNNLSDNTSKHVEAINTKSQDKQIDIYKEFLKQNPTGPAADKVRQKLAQQKTIK
jgi:hypothetical protein